MRDKKAFNFVRRWEASLDKAAGKEKTLPPKMVLSATIGITMIILLVSAPFLWEYKVNFDREQLEQKISDLRSIDNLVKKQQSLKNQVDAQQQVLDLVNKSNQDPGPILERLRQLLPVGTTVTTFNLQADRTLTLGVAIPNPVDVARLWTTFRDSGMFQSVDIQTVSLMDKIQMLNLNLKLK